ncbi:hypothetical protein [Mycobacterium sp. URHD0025]|uniref:hypothetical protein n=1 Tax=Mycobacterium sp. URHD0025 TaxID=1298864 RepID=UPI0012DE0699|nr:hypothetical protein [Mycobacterium sp. URHD0025]
MSGRKATMSARPPRRVYWRRLRARGVEPGAMYMVVDDLTNDDIAGQVVGMAGVLALL